MVRGKFKNPELRKKRIRESSMRDTIIKQFKNGRQAWQKGLTKETSEGIRKISEKMKGNKHGLGHTLSLEKRKAQSVRMMSNQCGKGVVFTKERRDKIGRANSIALKGRKIPEEVLEKQLLTKIRNGNMIDPKLLSEFENYRIKVWIETRKHKKKLFDKWNGFCFYTKEYIFDFYNKSDYNNPKYPVIDHKISIFSGFKDKIKPEVIGGINNLCICTRKINGVKNKRKLKGGNVNKMTNNFYG